MSHLRAISYLIQVLMQRLALIVFLCAALGLFAATVMASLAQGSWIRLPLYYHGEPTLLEVAAQMSHVSRELATVYAVDKIARARSFLEQRQQEIELFNSRLEQAKSISTGLRHWVHEIELEESVAAAQLDRLRAEMLEIMPELGLEKTVRNNPTALDNTIVDLQPKAAE